MYIFIYLFIFIFFQNTGHQTTKNRDPCETVNKWDECSDWSPQLTALREFLDCNAGRGEHMESRGLPDQRERVKSPGRPE